jgi:tRNA(fMet)-specific endonuclease VapC
MKQYLLDSDVSIDYLRGSDEIIQKVQMVGATNLYISEITVAELKYGAEKSNRPEHNQRRVNSFCAKFGNIPIFETLGTYTFEKARLEKLGLRLDDFDLLIGATAIHYGLILVTNNVKHFERMKGLSIENWTTQVE